MTWRIEQGDCREFLAAMASESVHMVCTSPPYYGLRDYKLPPLIWGGTWRGSLGLEPSLELYLDHLLEVFEGVKRVLRSDGVLFCNLGDSYYKSGYGIKGSELKPLNLLGVPWRFALRMQEEQGWYLRSAVVWAKGNPTPESVVGWRWERHRIKVLPRGHVGEKITAVDNQAPHAARDGYAAIWANCPGCPKCSPNDGLALRKGAGRTTSAYELVFVFTKSTMYYYDSYGFREPHSASVFSLQYQEGYQESSLGLGANLRDIWLINPEPFKGAHSATFPTELVRRCILLGASERGCCPECGSPWARIVKPSPAYQALIDDARANLKTQDELEGKKQKSNNKISHAVRDYQTLGWRATCSHKGLEPVPCMVLDPFAGSGSTGIAATRLGRDFIGIDLSGRYVKMARRRIAEEAPQANTVEVAQELGDIQLGMFAQKEE